MDLGRYDFYLVDLGPLDRLSGHPDKPGLSGVGRLRQVATRFRRSELAGAEMQRRLVALIEPGVVGQDEQGFSPDGP